MLKFFFHRHSFMVRLTEAIGAAGIVATAYLAAKGHLSPLQLILSAAIVAEYVFVRFCVMWRWYPGLPKGYGITLQFEKALVPTGYIMSAMLWLFLISKSTAVLVVAVFLLTVVAHVNAILIYLHFKDRDKTPVNAFSMTH